MQNLPSMPSFKHRYFWAGIALRLLCVPFLLQWFHPDERQMFEFAHFHAHGRLHPFLESHLHLRNQSLPVLFSYVIQFFDAFGLHHPWIYLVAIQSIIGVASWCCLYLFLEQIKIENPIAVNALNKCSWFCALFWGFPLLYSRQLLEAVSLPSTLLIYVFMRQRKFTRAGLLAGLTGIIRYPSFLWAAGAGLLGIYQAHKNSEKYLVRNSAKFILGLGVAILLGGIADYFTYGKFLGSASAYWQFNQPHGPVETMFGHDSLSVYWRWFEFLFTPWLAPLVILGGIYSLFFCPELLLFSLPYILGHLWTPHREPRFMLPLTPVLCVAIALAWGKGKFRVLNLELALVRPQVKSVVRILVTLHIALNFVWYPLTFWGQWSSSLGTVIRNYSVIQSYASQLITQADPLIDVLIPDSIPWADSNCQWHRPHSENSEESFWVLKAERPLGCQAATSSIIPSMDEVGLFARVLRVRPAELWSCGPKDVAQLCQNGFRPAPPGEPYLGNIIP